jgi:putative nucleotidyltransferase with HDIG domain
MEEQEILEMLTTMVEEKDIYTAGHSKRVAMYSAKIAEALSLSESDQNTLYQAGLLHDIGKMLTPESILLKPRKFNRSEYAIIKRHSEDGAHMLSFISSFVIDECSKSIIAHPSYLSDILRILYAEFQNDFVDHNLNSLGWWIQKHNGYSVREAIDLINLEIPIVYNNNVSGILSTQAQQKRQKKLKYARMPLFWRAFYYFVYRYFFKFGFLDGKPGFLWHFLQGWWYRTLVDAKIYEIKKHCGNDPEKIKEFIANNYQIKL